MRFGLRVLGGLALASLMAVPAAAQTGKTINGDIAVTYSWMRVQVQGNKTTFDKGFHFTASKKFINNISLFAGFGDSFTKNSATKSFLQFGGGVRFQTNRYDRVRPFAEAFFGAANDKAAQANHFSVLEYGGGVDLALSNKLALRAQISNPLYLFFGPVRKAIRAQFGVVIPVGK